MNKKLNVEGNLFSMGNDKQESKEANVSNNNKNVNKKVYKNVTKNVSGNVSPVNNEVNNITIKITRPELEDETMRMTYHLKVKTIRKVKVLARHADMGVSEFLQTVLDNVLDNIKIE